MNPKFEERVIEALAAVDSAVSLREVVKSELDRGAPADDVLRSLEAMRSTLSEPSEDAVLDVMDVLVGWCSPARKLGDPPD